MSEWTPWGGGECPVSADEVVWVLYQNGKEEPLPYKAGSVGWSHIFAGANVVGYKVVVAEPLVGGYLIEALLELKA